MSEEKKQKLKEYQKNFIESKKIKNKYFFILTNLSILM